MWLSVLFALIAVAILAYAVINLRQGRLLGGIVLVLIALGVAQMAYWSTARIDDEDGPNPGIATPTAPAIEATP